MARLFSNNAFGTLAANILSTETQLTLVTSQGERFPSPTGGDDFFVTLIGESGSGTELAWEIVRVTARENDTLTIVRGQENTTPANWALGTRVELRWTAAAALLFPQYDSLGNLGVGTNAPTAPLDVNGNTLRLRAARTPASATAAGNPGDICWDASFIYVCVATNTWERAPIASW